MQAIKQYPLQIALILILLSIKFVIIPVFNWQDEQLMEIQLLSNKISRIDNVLANRIEIGAQNAQIEKMLASTAGIFLTSDNVTTFQLEQQQWLEDKIKQYQLDVSNIGWSPQQMLSEFNLTAHYVQLNVDGKSTSIITFLQDLQAQPHYIAIQAFNVNFKRQNKMNLGTARVRLNLVFYRQAGSV